MLRLDISLSLKEKMGQKLVYFRAFFIAGVEAMLQIRV